MRIYAGKKRSKYGLVRSAEAGAANPDLLRSSSLPPYWSARAGEGGGPSHGALSVYNSVIPCLFHQTHNFSPICCNSYSNNLSAGALNVSFENTRIWGKIVGF